MYINGKTIYSYGSHFPMAIRGAGGVEVLVNGDSFCGEFCGETSQHQGHLLAALKKAEIEHPTISLSALVDAGVEVAQPDSFVVVDFQPDSWTSGIRRLGAGFEREVPEEARTEPSIKYLPWEPPGGGSFIEAREAWHVLGAAVVRVKGVKRGNYLLCSMDEGCYFVSRLPRRALTVDEAFLVLKPDAIFHAEELGLQIQRQGEWFAVLVAHDDGRALSGREMAVFLGLGSKKELLEKSAVGALPRISEEQNRHVVRHFTSERRIFATRRMLHKHPTWDRSTEQHAALQFRDSWWQMHRNTELMSWSQNGWGVD